MLGLPPPINDITTDTADPPVFTALLRDPKFAGRRLAWPRKFEGPMRRGYPDLGPLRLSMSADEAFALVQRVAAAMPRFTVTRADAAARELEGLERTRLFRFVDDFVVRVRPDGDGARIDMRSRSRLGRGDLGVNAKRIRAFWAAVRDAAPSASGGGGSTPR